MAAMVEVCGAYGLTLEKRKTETMVMRRPHHAQEDLEILAEGQQYAQTEQFVYLGGTITAEADMTAEIRRRTGQRWRSKSDSSKQKIGRPCCTGAVTGHY